MKKLSIQKNNLEINIDEEKFLSLLNKLTFKKITEKFEIDNFSILCKNPSYATNGVFSEKNHNYFKELNCTNVVSIYYKFSTDFPLVSDCIISFYETGNTENAIQHIKNTFLNEHSLSRIAEYLNDFIEIAREIESLNLKPYTFDMHKKEKDMILISDKNPLNKKLIEKLKLTLTNPVTQEFKISDKHYILARISDLDDIIFKDENYSFCFRCGLNTLDKLTKLPDTCPISLAHEVCDMCLQFDNIHPLLLQDFFLKFKCTNTVLPQSLEQRVQVLNHLMQNKIPLNK